MEVKSIECQLIQAQMKRYLAGADFPDELLDQMERHLKACAMCKAEANRQREALGGAPAEIAQAVVTAKKKPGLVDSLKSKVIGTRPSGHDVQGLVSAAGQAPFPVSPLDVLRTPKNLILSIGLAAVLVTMSTVMRQPSAFFGQRAAAVIAEKPHSEGESGAAPEHDEHAEAGGGHAETPPELSPDLREETKAPPTVDHGHTGNETPEAGHVKEPETHATEATTKPHKETVTHQFEKVGGDVLIADSAAPPKKIPTKSVVKTSKPKSSPTSDHRPVVRSTASKSKPKARISKRRAPRSVVRIYQP